MVFSAYLEFGGTLFYLLLAVLCILLCIDILVKSKEKLARTMVFFIMAFIPQIICIFSKIFNIEILYKNSIFSLGMSLFSIIFVFLGLLTLNSLVREVKKELPKKEISKNGYKNLENKSKKPKKRMIILRDS